MDRTNCRPKTMENHHIYKFFGFQQSGSIENSEKMEEFNEEDIWGSSIDPENTHVGFQENGCNGCNGVALCRSMGKEGNCNNRRRSVKTASKESCHEENNSRRIKYQASAPVTIPDWSQMIWKENSENYRRSNGIVDDNSDNDEDIDGKDFEKIPPHELIARQLAQSEITSLSVYDGVGRILKGRVRNAVWMRTGFID